MPAPGDQHSVVVNPFDDDKSRVSEYTAQEIATLQSRLEKKLGPEYLSERSGPGGSKVHYIAAEKCIALANEVFGFNGWSSAIKQIQVDFIDEHPQTLKISLGLSVIVRVTLRDGTFHEDIGYGHIENCTGKAKAFEKAKKEGTTDALKRALRNFGNVLGNCIYDKDYVKRVTKIKVQPNRTWDESGLHRHADFVKKEEVKVEPKPNNSVITAPSVIESFEDILGEFDEVDFNIVDDDHPDEVSVPQSEKPTPQPNTFRSNPPHMQPPAKPLARSHSVGNQPRPPQTPAGQQFSRPGPQNHSNQAAPRPQQQMNQSRSSTGAPGQASTSINHGLHQTPPPPQAPGHDGTTAPAMEPIGFFSARAVKQISGTKEDEALKLPNAPLSTQAFNPRAESPSIRKTPGVDHSKTIPLGRLGQYIAPLKKNEDPDDKELHLEMASVGAGKGGPVGAGLGAAVGQPQQGPASSQRGNMVNPQFNQTRRIGAPMGPGSPLANRGQYRPPTIKRPALSDVSTNGIVNANAGAGGGGAVGGDPKRQKVG